MRRALVLGATGQDGQLISHHLIQLGYEVVGAARKIPTVDQNPLHLHRPRYVVNDITDRDALSSLILQFKPTEIYNLAGQSSVAQSFSKATQAFESNERGVLNLLNIVKKFKLHKSVRIFQASTSEMFGGSKNQLVENSPMSPCSPYAESKLRAHLACQRERLENGLWISTGILFNHESELRPSSFVFKKIVAFCVDFASGSERTLKLGNLNVSRDWGYAGDYVLAMHKCLTHQVPEDFIVATGEVRSIKDVISQCLIHLKIKGRVEDLVEIDESLKRPQDIEMSWGNPTKAHQVLGWKSETSFVELVAKMTNYQLSLRNI